MPRTSQLNRDRVVHVHVWIREFNWRKQQLERDAYCDSLFVDVSIPDLQDSNKAELNVS
jgi:hypothetical protein